MDLLRFIKLPISRSSPRIKLTRIRAIADRRFELTTKVNTSPILVKTQTLFEAVVVLCTLAAVTALAHGLINEPMSFQFDLRTYYLAGTAYREGGNPYEIRELVEMANVAIDRPFVYPPHTLPILSLASSVAYSSIAKLFLFTKLLAFLCLVVVWLKAFIRHRRAGLLVFAVLSFNAAVYVDFRAGNISIFEQLLLWAAFASLLERRFGRFSLLILFASFFKLSLLLFSLLLLIYRDKRATGVLGIIVGLAAATLLLSFVLAPDYFGGWLLSLGQLDERGVLNPSLFELVADMSNLVARLDISVPAEVLKYSIAIALLIPLILITFRFFARERSKDAGPNSVAAVCAACLIYSLVMPRMMVYSLIILIVPTYHVLQSKPELNGLSQSHTFLSFGFRMPILAIISSLSLITYFSASEENMILAYTPLYLALYAWIRLMRDHQIESGGTSGARPNQRRRSLNWPSKDVLRGLGAEPTTRPASYVLRVQD